MTTHDLLSHFNLTQLPFSKEITVEHLLGLPSLERVMSSRTAPGGNPRHRASYGQIGHRQKLPPA